MPAPSRMRSQKGARAEEFRSRLCLSRAIVRGVSSDSIFPQIARAARRFIPAEFVVLGRAGSPPELAETWNGRECWRGLLEQRVFRNAWSRVLDKGRQVEIRDKSVLIVLNAQSGETVPAIERVIGMPIEGRTRTHGVLMAGLITSEDRDDDTVRLEAYALLASAAIEQEFTHEERTQWMSSFERAVEESVESHHGAEMVALMQAIDSGVLLLDAKGNIRAVSERLAQIMGVESQRLAEVGTIGALIDGIAGRFAQPAKTVARWRERIEQAGEPCWDEFELIRPARKVVERFSRPVLAPDGERLGWLEVYRDITGQRLIQTNLLRTEKISALGQLVSGIAHELNNPLTSIQGYAQLLGRRHGPNGAADARRIAEEAARAGTIVRNLLLFAREGRAERRAVDLNEIVERTTALRGYELRVENIRLELSLEPSLPQILGDAGQLQQVVLNLIVNAEQAIEQSRRQGRIRIRTRRLAGNRVALDVYDDGLGIPPEIASRIFDPFFTTKPAGVGTGLGLSIVYGIVHEHGGEVGVESEPGKGATLTVELPALTGAALESSTEESREKAVTAAVVPAARPAVPAQSTRILVVEDEPTVAQLIADVVVEEGHSIETVLDSRDALKRLQTNDYGLVICDLKMPHLDGPALYRALGREANPVQRRLLFVTGDTMSPRTLEFLKASGLPYLAKPFLVEELKQAVRQALGEAPAGEEALPGRRSPRTAVRRT